jgi:hypothetical protein
MAMILAGSPNAPILTYYQRMDFLINSEYGQITGLSETCLKFVRRAVESGEIAYPDGTPFSVATLEKVRLAGNIPLEKTLMKLRDLLPSLQPGAVIHDSLGRSWELFDNPDNPRYCLTRHEFLSGSFTPEEVDRTGNLDFSLNPIAAISKNLNAPDPVPMELPSECQIPESFEPVLLKGDRQNAKLYLKRALASKTERERELWSKLFVRHWGLSHEITLPENSQGATWCVGL